MRKIIAYFVHNPILTNVLILVIAMMVARRLTTAAFVRIGGPGTTSLEPHDQRA